MRLCNSFVALTVSMIAALAGCAADASEPVVSGACEGLVADNRLAGNRISLNRISLNRIALNRIALNRISANRLAANKLAANKLSANKLATNKLAGNRIALNRISLNGVAASCQSITELELDSGAAAELLATEDNRELLRYTVGCALAADQLLVGEHEGVRYEFAGDVGLAPAWSERGLVASEQRWVSACLFARTNAHDLSVQISMRGDHPALAVSSAEAAEWSLEEGAFWGNLFAPEDQPIDWNACEGTDQAATESGDLAARDCSEPDTAHDGLTQCGFQYAGLCGDAGKLKACSSYDAEGQFYSDCTSPTSEQPAVAEVITTFVRP